MFLPPLPSPLPFSLQFVLVNLAHDLPSRFGWMHTLGVVQHAPLSSAFPTNWQLESEDWPDSDVTLLQDYGGGIFFQHSVVSGFQFFFLMLVAIDTR